MELSVLPDSSFYISRLRNGLDPFGELAAFADDTDFLINGLVMTEVLRGTKNPKTRDRLLKIMESMLYVPTTNLIWEKVREMSWELDRTGNVMQVTDLLIAVSALERDAAVLTLDSDFRRIPGLRVIDILEQE